VVRGADQLDESKQDGYDDGQIKEEQVALLFQSLPLAMVATALVTGVICYVLWTVVPASRLVWWSAAVLSVTVVRLGMLIAYHKSTAARANGEMWLTWFVGTLAIYALLFGSANWVIYPQDDLPSQLILILLIIGIASGGAITLAAHLPSVVLFVTALLAPLAFRFGFDDDLPFILGPMTLVYGLVLINTSRNLTGFIRQSLSLRQDKETVIKDLRKSELALREKEIRYRRLFDTAEVSLWDEDFSYVQPALNDLRLSGITDLREYLSKNPEEVSRILSLIRINSVNEATLKLYGVASSESFIENLEGIVSDETIDVFVEVLCALWSGERYFSAEVSHRTFDGRDISVVFSLPIPASPEEWQNVPVSVLDITERKAAEQLLGESEEKYRSVVSSTVLGVIVHQDDRVLFANPAIAGMHGYTTEEMVGMNRHRLIAQSEMQKLREFVQSRSEGLIEFKGLRKDGSSVWLEGAGTDINWNGRPARLNTVINVSARKDAELRLQESEARFRNLAEGSLQGIMVHQGDFIPIFANNAYAHIFGFEDAEELMDLGTVEGLINVGELKRMKKFTQSRRKGNTAPGYYEYKGRKKDGSSIWLDNYVSLVEWDGKQAIHSTVIDVTGRHIAERELRISEAKFSGILEIAPEAIISTDAAGIILMFNNGAQDIFGYDQSAAIGLSIDMFMPARFRQGHARKMVEFGESGDDTRRMSEREGIICCRKDGTEFPAEASVSKLTIGDDQIFNVILHDISQRKRVEHEVLEAKETAEAASRTKTEFLANMSHELRTPLNAILGFSEIIIGESFGPLQNKRYKEYAEDIHNSGVHLLELINDVLDVSKIEAGALKLTEGILDMDGVVSSALRYVKERAFTKSVQISVDIEPALPLIRGDERAVKQIVLNILSNSIKFTNPGGVISVKGECDENGRVCLTIADTGVGIASSDLKTVLEPFGQVGAVDTRRNEGTGLGLPLAKSLAELHNAVFELDSTLGEGTTVSIRFPKDRCVEVLD